MTDLPQNRAALFVQTDCIAEGLEASMASSQPDLTALCFRLDGIEKTVLVKGADAFELTGKQASNLRLADLLCESDPEGAANQLREIRTAQGS